MIKKKMSLLLAAVLVASGVVVATPASAATVAPKVTYVAPSITMAEVGDEFSFALQSDVATKVQYQIHAQDLATGKWYSLTNGYTEAVNGRDPFIPATINTLPAGAYKASIWVKAEGSTAKYDSYTTTNFKIQKDGHFDGRAKLDSIVLEDTYAVGDSVEIAGSDLYMIHTYSSDLETSTGVRAKAWNNDTNADRDGYEDAAGTSNDITFTAPGKYLVNVWGKKADSKNKYDGWKLQVVTVTEKAVSELPAYEISEPDTTSVPFSTLVTIKLDTKTPENYKVTVDGVELPLETDKDGNKIFMEVLDGTLTKADIEAKLVIVDTNVKVEVPTAEVLAVDTTSVPFSTLVSVKLNTTTPENFKVTVDGVELPLETAKDGSKVFMEVLDGTLTKADIEAGIEVTVK